MSTSGIRRLGASMVALTAAYFNGGRPNGNIVPQEAVKNRFNQRTGRFSPRLDVYYLSSAWKKASKKKNYPFSSQRQNERFCRNYSTDDNGNIFAVGRKHHKEIERLMKEKVA